MEIDLMLLHSGTVNEIDISKEYVIPKEYYSNTEIQDIKELNVTGKIYRDVSEFDEDELDDYIDCNIEGKMIIKDSISLNDVEYPFSIEYNDILEENCKKNENILDIFQFLCENIVLEVPLQFTKVKDLSEFHGDGWKLISEEDVVTTNNPFNELLKDFKEEWLNMMKLDIQMFAVPFRKVSKTRKRMRRSHNAMDIPGTTKCPGCGEMIKPHRVCPKCGNYKGKKVVETNAE